MATQAPTSPSGVRTVPGPAHHLPAFAEGLRRLGARDCLIAHVRRPADLSARPAPAAQAVAHA